MLVLDVEQGSDEWFAARVGIPSASCFNKIATGSGQSSKQAEDYAYQLAGERITGQKTETYQTPAMARGIELEAEARELFEFIHDIEVKQVGLVYFDDRKRYSCSPDGLMDDCGLEIKCPSMHVHIKYLIKGGLPADYYQQVHGSMHVTGLKAWWFMSYYPGLPPFIIKVERDETFCTKLATLLDVFCHDLDELTDKLRGM